MPLSGNKCVQKLKRLFEKKVFRMEPFTSSLQNPLRRDGKTKNARVSETRRHLQSGCMPSAPTWKACVEVPITSMAGRDGETGMWPRSRKEILLSPFLSTKSQMLNCFVWTMHFFCSNECYCSVFQLWCFIVLKKNAEFKS